MSEFHVSVFKEHWHAGLSITVWREVNGKILVVKPAEMIWEEIRKGDSAPPTLRLDHFIAPAFLKACAEALDKAGVKTDDDAKLAGTIKAQSYHLEDLRRLLKLPSGGPNNAGL